MESLSQVRAGVVLIPAVPRATEPVVLEYLLYVLHLSVPLGEVSCKSRSW